MPIYEYHCPKCGTFDVMRKITEKPLRKCPTCKAKVQKLMSNTAFQLKGTGWYVTDYPGKGKKDSDGEAGKSETSTADSAKSDTKSDAKSESKGATKESAASAPKPAAA